MAKAKRKVNGRNAIRQLRMWTMAKDDPERAARLAEALRQNLRRRKAQAREVPPMIDPEKEPEVER